MQNTKTFFEQWLSETLKNDPCYAFNIVCNYYDDCQVCPLCPKSHHTCELTQAMAQLIPAIKGDNEK